MSPTELYIEPQSIASILRDRVRLQFSEREVWFASLGDVIGNEINGKGLMKCRPVLILKKFTRETFLALPMTSHIKNGTYYYAINFRGNPGVIVLNQGRMLDSKRLMRRVGLIPQAEYHKIKQSFVALFA